MAASAASSACRGPPATPASITCAHPRAPPGTGRTSSRTRAALGPWRARELRETCHFARQGHKAARVRDEIRHVTRGARTCAHVLDDEDAGGRVLELAA